MKEWYNIFMFKKWARAGATFLLVISPTLVLAAGMPTQIVTCTGATGDHPCGICDIASTAQNILNTGIYIAIFLSAILFAWAGWKYVSARGDTSKVSTGRTIFTNVAIGLVLILAAWLIVDTLMKLMVGDNAAFGPWNKIC